GARPSEGDFLRSCFHGSAGSGRAPRGPSRTGIRFISQAELRKRSGWELGSPPSVLAEACFARKALPGQMDFAGAGSPQAAARELHGDNLPILMAVFWHQPK